MNIWIAAADKATEPSLQLGWMGLLVPVSLAAIGAIVRAFTAESRVLKDCGDDVSQVRDGVLTDQVQPTLAAVIVRIHPYIDFGKKKFLKGEPGDPEYDTQRVLGYNPTFSDSYTDLENHYARIRDAQAVHGRRVGHAQRIGWASSGFLIAWAYFGFWLCMPAVNFPEPLTLSATVVGSAALGWAGAEGLGSVRENNMLSTLTREARSTGGSTR